MGTCELIPSIGAAVVTPLSIPTLTGWYDFSDIATLFQDTARATPVTADAQLIGSVADKSGGGRHLARGGAAGTEPVYKAAIRNGRSISRWDSTKWMLSGTTFAADTEQTIIVVANNTGGTTLMSPWSRSNNTNNRFTGNWNNSVNSLGAFFGTGAGSYSELWASATTGWVVVTTIVNNTGPISQVYGDRTLRSSATGTPSVILGTQTAIGSRQIGSLSNGFNSDIGEVLVFSTALGTADRVAAETFLKARWGTA